MYIRRTKKGNLRKYPWMVGVTFHVYPGPRRNPTLRRKWVNQVFREDSYVPKRHHRVCSLHFVDGFPTKDNPVHTLFPRNNYRKEPPAKRSRLSIEKRQFRQVLRDVYVNVPAENDQVPSDYQIQSIMNATALADGRRIPLPVYSECIISTTDNLVDVKKEVDAIKQVPEPHSKTKTANHTYIALHKNFPEYQDITVQTRLSIADIDKMESESATYSNTNILLDLFVKKATSTDASVRKYFGLPSIALLLGIFSILQAACSKLEYWSGTQSMEEKRYEKENHKKPGPNRKLTLFQEYLLTLLRIRLAVNTHIHSDLFGVSESRVSQIFSTLVNFMYRVFAPHIKWSSRANVKKHMPKSFKKSFPGTRIIIDCTEVFIQKSRNPKVQSQTYSNYKSHNTFKTLVNVTSSGAFSFISEFWGGNVSDRYVTAHSGFLDKISPGDEVMADRGFVIADYLLERKAKLIMPPFTRKCSWGKGKRLSPTQIQKTREIAKLRIHVERAIQRLKCFRILSGVLPLSVKSLANQILVIAAFLCNLSPPLVKN